MLIFKKTITEMTTTVWVYRITLLIIIGVAIMRYKKLTSPFRALSVSVIITFFMSILSNFFSRTFKTNAPVLHVAAICEYIFFATAYYYLFKSKIIKKLILISLIVLVVFFFINGIFIQPINKEFPTYIYLPTELLFALFSLLMFKQMLSYPLKLNIVKQSVFWYNTAMLFYATALFLNLGLTNYFAKHHFQDDRIYYFLFHFWYGILDIFYILIGISIFADKKNIITAHV